MSRIVVSPNPRLRNSAIAESKMRRRVSSDFLILLGMGILNTFKSIEVQKRGPVNLKMNMFKLNELRTIQVTAEDNWAGPPGWSKSNVRIVCQASVPRDAFPPTPPGPEGSNGNGLLRVQWVPGAWLKIPPTSPPSKPNLGF